jgi:DNA-binding transcriptional MerR regulator
MAKILSIGEAAKFAGVSVQTLRHYDKLGLLAPSHVSAAGYRRYSERDCERLQMIRALREVGFDLETIGQLLASKIDTAEAISIRFEALEAEQRAVRRRQLLLRAATNGKRKNVLARLRQKHVLAKLDRFERESFLERHFAWAPHDTPESQAVWRAAIFDLPEQMDDAQLEAWLELAEIAADERFHRTLKRQFEWTRGLDESKVSEWSHTFQRLLADARGLRERNPDGEPSPTLIDAWIGGFARLHSRTPDANFARWMLKRLESSYDVQIGRYWELICKIKRIPYDPTYARAFGSLLSILRERVDSEL